MSTGLISKRERMARMRVPYVPKSKQKNPRDLDPDIEKESSVVPAGGAVGPDGKTSGPIEVPLETMEYVTEDVAPKKETVDQNIMGLLNKGIVQKGNVYSYNPTQAEADKETLVSNRQDLFHEMKGWAQRGYGAASDEMKAVREEALSRYGVSPEAFDTAFGKTDLGKKEQRAQKEKDRLARYNEFYDRTMGAGSGLAGRKRKLYARNAELKRAIQLRKKGFGSAAERLALGAASSLEAQGPAVASQGYLQALEDNKAQANRQRAINQQLGVRLLAGLQNI